jgi:hypothetical protein
MKVIHWPYVVIVRTRRRLCFHELLYILHCYNQHYRSVIKDACLDNANCLPTGANGVQLLCLFDIVNFNRVPFSHVSKSNTHSHGAEPFLRSCELCSYSGTSSILWNPEVHYRVYKRPPLVPILSPNQTTILILMLVRRNAEYKARS